MKVMKEQFEKYQSGKYVQMINLEDIVSDVDDFGGAL